MRQKRILLRFVETVNLVHEQQRAAPHTAAVAGAVEYFAQVGNARENRGYRLEMQ